MANKISKVKNRRAISSIIGAFFFLVLMVAVFGAILVAFQYQSQLVGTNRAIADKQLAKVQEQFAIRQIVGGAGPYTVSAWIDNTGGNQVEIVDIWAINTADGSEVKLKSISSPSSIVPSGASVKFLAGNEFSLVGGSYTLKAVSALGNMRTTTFSAPDTGGAGSEIVIDTLIAKPSVYAAFPNPFPKKGSGGDNNGHGIFSIIIGNPTGVPMRVTQVAIQLLAPNNPHQFGNVYSQLSPPFGTWQASVPADDVAYWLYLPGINIPTHSARNFTARIYPTSSVGSSPIVTVNTNAWTSFGQFGSSKIDTLATSTDILGIPNIYFTTASTSNPRYVIGNVTAGQSQTFYVTLKNSQEVTTASAVDKIQTGSYMIINLPSGWGDPSYSAQANLIPQPIITFDDKSKQLPVKVNTELAPTGSITFSFSSLAPSVSKTTLYVFHIYGNGTTNNGNTEIGPVAETIVQVCVTPPCS